MRTLDSRKAVLGDAAGRVRLVHFFATWCFTCLIETPGLSAMASDLGGCGLDVVGVGMDLEGEKVLAPFAEMNGLSFPVLVPGEALREGKSLFGPIQALPTTFLFGRDGRLVQMWEGPAEPGKLRQMVEGELGRCRR